jgi:predicted kinase
VSDATLYFMCGKMAAGKSSLARELAHSTRALLWIQDEFLAALFPGEIISIADYVRCSARLRFAVGPRVQELLMRNVSIVLDFPANTRTQRTWFRELIERTGVRHEMHYIDVPDEVCKRQLRQRSEALPPGALWTSDAEFDAITAYFEEPGPDESFNVIRHVRT